MYMKTINKIFFYLLLAVTVFTPFSCTDYLDVSSELAENLDIKMVFEKPDYTRNWYAAMYQSICEYSSTGSGTATDGWKKNPWSGISGELMINYSGTGVGVVKDLLVNGYTPANARFHRWANQYSNIRQALIFLQNVKPINDTGERSSVSLPESEVNQMKAEAKVMLAYMYFTLFELYGPVPLVTEIANPDDTNLDYSRASMDETINYIDGLLNEAIESGHLLPTTDLVEIIRPTKTVALALRAKLWVYAASKLFNGGFAESLLIKNNDGKRLFPDYDASKWQTAKTHLETFLAYAGSVGHQLYKEYDSATGEINGHNSIYNLFQYVNPEIIWFTSVNDYSERNNAEARSKPRDIINNEGYATIGVSQETVDAFFMANGLNINDNGSGYAADGFTDIVNPCNQNQRLDQDVFNMYANREPRFYASVTYPGKSWHIQPPGKTGYQYWAAQRLGNQSDAGDSWPRGGYLLYKFKNRTILYNTGAQAQQFARPSILLRLADFYLYYAEVLNEINPTDPQIIEYLDAIRERAGIPGYQKLHNDGLKTNIIGNQENQRIAIYRERWVELLGEGQRWFDMRRWMICDPTEEARKYGGDITRFTGLNMGGYEIQARYNYTTNTLVTPPAIYPIGDPNSFYTRSVVENRHWNRAMYWYPVPQNEINKSTQLKQNPLWEAVRDE